MGTESFNEQYGQHYDLLYHDKNYDQECTYIDGLIKKFAPGALSILELGCGTGKHATILENLGYQVFGIDRSEALLRASKIRGVQCELGDIKTFKVDKKFDVALAMFHVISYLTADGDLETALRNIKSHLIAKGIFIFDVWYTPGVMNLLPQVREKKVSDEHLEIERIAIPLMDNNNKTVTIKYNFKVANKDTESASNFEEVHLLKHFNLQEIEKIAMQSGFVVLKSEELVTGREPSNSSWGVNFILQAQ